MWEVYGHLGSTMSETNFKLWRGLNAQARAALATRDYAVGDLAVKLCDGRAEAREVISGVIPSELAIPGVEVFHRRVFQQRHRGYFAEFAREGDGRGNGRRL
jgi:hypothetical protein